MGGQILDYEAKDILNVGREEGILLTKAVYRLQRQGKNKVEIAKECNISVEKVEEILE